ncbi:tRNA (N(6)-L-threonylcarbamoyladenosine(37)-C(2))-methylthiotransferase MtaB [uncultured Alistipes sp.]|uniref:tRNA (N(6)-L-threonylcarbamoyladenosine(37)-C(2))- methylthiotransferase MtaB n=1 Tax=uncultured Alistipes sp. TaxID=538949 RepID=UPI00261E4A0A|nr:tRNA (N(6)-L-threonylcarbamoyladenosine(37)-C(2))-methylthiotransferase MtaB [uncultured Alistipes sp.]
MSSERKVKFCTLGCKLNFSETSTIAREFEQGGFRRAQPGEKADICVVNSCSVTEHADKKCRNLVRRLIRENPGALVAVTGCYAQLSPERIAAIEGVDLVIGNGDKGSVYRRVAALEGKSGAAVHACEAEELTGFFAAFSSGDRTRSFLKVQDGCDYRCSYCTIPLARGVSRNMPIADLVAEAEAIARSGQREIVLTGVNTGDFGRTTGESFLDLLRALDGVEGIDRYRISSIEPNLLTDEIIAFTASSRRFQPHFHIPIQSGCDRILALMRRRYNTARFAERIAAVRRAMPDVFLGIDVIVGFPGETEEDFACTYDFLERIAPAFLHVFPYSVRPGTPAAELPGRVPPETAERRAARLGELSGRLHADFCARHAGRVETVLWESTLRGGYMFGYTGNYIKVRAPYDRSKINTLSRVELLLSEGDTMEARIIG